VRTLPQAKPARSTDHHTNFVVDHPEIFALGDLVAVMPKVSKSQLQLKLPPTSPRWLESLGFPHSSAEAPFRYQYL